MGRDRYGVGYVIGCLASIVLWKLERRRVIRIFNTCLCRCIPKLGIVEILYIVLIGIILYMFVILPQCEAVNFITAFLVIDISNTERKNLSLNERTHFYDSISMISRSIVGGFIAPLLYIAILGNGFGIAYMLLFNISTINDYPLIKRLFNIASIIPSALLQVFLYGVYLARNKKLTINFKGDYLINCVARPLLNIDILGAYIESVNFYYYFSDGGIHYVKSYGEYTNKIDIICIKDYLSITYGIAMIYFVAFFILIGYV